MAEVNCLPGEEWRPVLGFEKFYEVSNMGRLKSIPRAATRKNGSPYTVRGKILATYVDANGYRTVSLNNRPKPMGHAFDVGRLVALAFGVITEEQEVDHRNRIRDDDRLCNLRPANRSENTSNRNKQSNNTSGVPGVVWDKSRSKWAARVEKNGTLHNLGRFASFQEAVRARHEGAKKLHGDFAALVE